MLWGSAAAASASSGDNAGITGSAFAAKAAPAAPSRVRQDSLLSPDTGAGNFRYVRASGDGQITIEGSNSILGTWTNLGNLSGIGLTGTAGTAGTTGTKVEGPMWMKFRDRNEWALYLDQYASRGGYMPVTTTNPKTLAAMATARGPRS